MNHQLRATRRQFIGQLAAITGAAAVAHPAAIFSATSEGRKTPVILTTDIGDDIDDTWALGLLLKSPEIDLKLAVGDYGKREYRAKLLAKFLSEVGRGNVPVGMGVDVEPRGDGPQAPWVKGYELNSYPGKVHQDGIAAMIETIMSSPEPVTLIAIGPMPNVAAALTREPRIAEKARLVGMYGSVHRGYDGSTTLSAEWNVKADPKSCQKAFTAPWDITITPLDTCGLVTLDGDRYKRILDSKDPIPAKIIENYRIWSKANKPENKVAETRSSTLFDTVAVYLACTQELCKMEKQGIRVTDDGFTRIDDKAKKVNAAVEWKNLDAYRDLLVARLTDR
jgi:inosine-uridine nucleoside N-ribohydrolase